MSQVAFLGKLLMTVFNFIQFILALLNTLLWVGIFITGYSLYRDPSLIYQIPYIIVESLARLN